MAVEKNTGIVRNFYKKLCLSVITWNKKHLLKQVVPITFTLGKTIFAVAAFECLWVVYFQTEWKSCSVLWFDWVIVGFTSESEFDNYIP